MMSLVLSLDLLAEVSFSEESNTLLREALNEYQRLYAWSNTQLYLAEQNRAWSYFGQRMIGELFSCSS